MKHLVVLDARSVVGAAYKAGDNDGLAHSHPFLTCTELDCSHPVYLLATRAYQHQGKLYEQKLRIPHGCVAYTVEHDSDDAELGRIGFQISRDTSACPCLSAFVS